jgi:hypothetical protein
MSRRLVLLLALTGILLALAIGGFVYLRGTTYVLAIPEADLQHRLAERMPMQRSVLGIIQITLDNPRVALVEGSNRVDAGLDITLNVTMGRQARPLGGTIDVSGGVRYQAEGGQLFLTDPVIEQFQVQGVPEQHAARVREALQAGLAEYFATRPIYTLRKTDARQAAARLLLRDIEVVDRELVITLGI